MIEGRTGTDIRHILWDLWTRGRALQARPLENQITGGEGRGSGVRGIKGWARRKVLEDRMVDEVGRRCGRHCLSLPKYGGDLVL